MLIDMIDNDVELKDEEENEDEDAEIEKAAGARNNNLLVDEWEI